MEKKSEGAEKERKEEEKEKNREEETSLKFMPLNALKIL